MSLFCRVVRGLGVALGAIPFLAVALGGPAPVVVESVDPAPGASLRELVTIEVQFSEPVLGVQAADLLLNSQPATNVTEVAPGDFLFTFPIPADGAVAVAWAADHGITDAATGLVAFAGGAWSYTLDTSSPAPGLLLSEFMADNRRTLHDEDGDSSDWIELYNSAETEASLEGWFLTDTVTNLARWKFPGVSVAGHGYLVLFASGKDRTDVAGRLHTNFKLPKEGGYLALVSPAGHAVSEFAPAYPKQFTDVSYGRAPGEPNTLGYFVKPTPGLLNAASGPGFAPDVRFSAPSGPFTNAFSLLLSAVSTNAVIRYTLDGTQPTNSSPVYLAPIPITNSTQVRARAYQEGLLPGPLHSENYLMLSNNVLGFVSDLPLLVINSMSKTPPNAGRYTYANLTIYEPVHGVTSLTNRPVKSLRAGIRLRGSSTEGYPKSSYAVELWNEFNEDADHSLLGLPEESDWVLYAPNNFEPVLIHNPFIHQLSRDIGQYSPRTRFVEVYLNRTGGPVASNSYNGIYVLEEKIKIGKNRVAIDKLEPEHVKPPEVTGGYLMKFDRLDPGDAGLSAGGALMCWVSPKERDVRLAQRAPQRTYAKTHFDAFAKALNGTNYTDPVLGYAPYIDLEQWIDYHILELLSANVDTMVLSCYFHKPRNGRITYGPHWDFDRALGSTDGRDVNPRLWLNAGYFTGWYSRVLRDKYAWQKWADRWQELRTTHLSNTNINRLIDQLTGEVLAAQPRERAKWKVALRGGSYQSEINLMKAWLSNRTDFIDTNFVSKPRLSHPGGPIRPGFLFSLEPGPKSANATIYYTLDGSDPRLPQGDIAPSARVYDAPLTFSNNVRVVARARDPARTQRGPVTSTPWSGPAAATFVVRTPPLLITEIMFHPAAPPAGSPYTASDFEFLELKNTGDTALDLVGTALTNGVEYTFTSLSAVTNLAPGERVLLVKNKAAFLSRYPGATHIAGEFAGSLGKGGDRLVVLGPLLEPVVDFRYDDAWQRLADGAGFSLVLADESVAAGFEGDPVRWRLSSRPGGSPGQGEPPQVKVKPVLLNEVLTHTHSPQLDAVEFYNPNPEAVDISGWFLTDDFATPAKYRFPSPTSIPPHGYLVVDETRFRVAGAAGFAFSSLGDQACLFSADADGTLTGYYHGFSFGAAENGVSFGRYLASDGREEFVAQERVTLGARNSGPRVGPVVVSEIMFDPPPDGIDNNTEDEFIELRNVGATPAPLFDPAHTTNTWHLRGGVDFDFAEGLTLPPRGVLLVVGFDPLADPASLARFRARYSLSAATPIYGPWQGHLDNAGDRIRLLKPDEPEPADAADPGFVPHVLVEEVQYAAQTPWPAGALGTGLSLRRGVLAGFGNDPGNWFAGPPTPGEEGPDGDTDGDGLSNATELAAGTDPSDPASSLRLQVSIQPGPTVHIGFTAMPAHGYQVLYRDSLLTGDWQVLRVFDPPAIASPVTVTDAPSSSARFYRLVTR